MLIKKVVKIFFIFFILLSATIYFYSNFYKKKIEKTIEITEELSNNSNIIENVKYQSTDAKGNKYIINALKGEIDFANSNIIYLTDIKSLIILKNSCNSGCDSLRSK